MKSRFPLILCLFVFAAACAGDSESGGMEDAADAAAGMTDADAAAMAAIEEIRAGYVQHYNLHHPSMVADYYGEDALVLAADGSVNDGRDAIEAGLEAAMAANPTLDIQSQEEMVFGDVAVARGAYTVDLAPEDGEPMSTSGHYMSVFNNEDGEWKLGMVLTNYDAPPPEGTPMVEPPEDGPPPDSEDTPHADLIAAWEQHYNLGHPDMVADLHTEDGVTMWADQPMEQGRAAIEAGLAQVMAEGSPQVEIHEVGHRDLGDGYHLGVGWYSVTVETPDGEADQGGTYMVLSRMDDDGQRRIHWAISNGAW